MKFDITLILVCNLTPSGGHCIKIQKICLEEMHTCKSAHMEMRCCRAYIIILTSSAETLSRRLPRAHRAPPAEQRPSPGRTSSPRSGQHLLAHALYTTGHRKRHPYSASARSSQRRIVGWMAQVSYVSRKLAGCEASEQIVAQFRYFLKIRLANRLTIQERRRQILDRASASLEGTLPAGKGKGRALFVYLLI